MRLTAFEPSARRAAALDRRMRARLGESLRYVLRQADGSFAFPPQKILEAFFKRLGKAAVPPLVFGAYCDLVLAIENDALAEARRLLAEIAAAPNEGDKLRIVDLAGGAGERYQRYVDTDPGRPFELLPPPPRAARACRGLIEEALSVMERGDAALAQEIRVLVREIVLAVAPEAPGAAVFDGASSFMLWGGVVLNARAHATRLDMVQALAHESGHGLLFGLCAEDALLEDEDGRTHTSPLRPDPRPMDGIVHATYVIARMHRAVSGLLAAGVLSDAEMPLAREVRSKHARAFAGGIDTVERHAHLSALGREVMAQARAYMATAQQPSRCARRAPARRLRAP